MPQIILRPKNYLRIILDIAKLKWAPPILLSIFLLLSVGVFSYNSNLFKKGESLGEQKGFVPESVLTEKDVNDLAAVGKNEKGEFTAQGSLVDKSYAELTLVLEEKIEEIKNLNINPWIVSDHLEKAKGLATEGDLEKAQEEVLAGIRLAEEIKIAQKLHSESE